MLALTLDLAIVYVCAGNEETLIVSHRINLQDLSHIDTIDGTAHIKISVLMYWTDTRLKNWSISIARLCLCLCAFASASVSASACACVLLRVCSMFDVGSVVHVCCHNFTCDRLLMCDVMVGRPEGKLLPTKLWTPRYVQG